MKIMNLEPISVKIESNIASRGAPDNFLWKTFLQPAPAAKNAVDLVLVRRGGSSSLPRVNLQFCVDISSKTKKILLPEVEHFDFFERNLQGCANLHVGFGCRVENLPYM